MKKSAIVKDSSPPRRDATGHLDPRYASDLRALSRSGVVKVDDDAFVSRARSNDPLAELLGEAAVSAATSGGVDPGESLDEGVEEDNGGPFVEATDSTELADDTDASNPADATREPFPTV